MQFSVFYILTVHYKVKCADNNDSTRVNIETVDAATAKSYDVDTDNTEAYLLLDKNPNTDKNIETDDKTPIENAQINITSTSQNLTTFKKIFYRKDQTLVNDELNNANDKKFELCNPFVDLINKNFDSIENAIKIKKQGYSEFKTNAILILKFKNEILTELIKNLYMKINNEDEYLFDHKMMLASYPFLDFEKDQKVYFEYFNNIFLDFCQFYTLYFEESEYTYDDDNKDVADTICYVKYNEDLLNKYLEKIDVKKRNKFVIIDNCCEDKRNYQILYKILTCAILNMTHMQNVVCLTIKNKIKTTEDKKSITKLLYDFYNENADNLFDIEIGSLENENDNYKINISSIKNYDQNLGILQAKQNYIWSNNNDNDHDVINYLWTNGVDYKFKKNNTDTNKLHAEWDNAAIVGVDNDLCCFELKITSLHGKWVYAFHRTIDNTKNDEFVIRYFGTATDFSCDSNPNPIWICLAYTYIQSNDSIQLINSEPPKEKKVKEFFNLVKSMLSKTYRFGLDYNIMIKDNQLLINRDDNIKLQFQTSYIDIKKKIHNLYSKLVNTLAGEFFVLKEKPFDLDLNLSYKKNTLIKINKDDNLITKMLQTWQRFDDASIEKIYGYCLYEPISLRIHYSIFNFEYVLIIIFNFNQFVDGEPVDTKKFYENQFKPMCQSILDESNETLTQKYGETSEPMQNSFKDVNKVIDRFFDTINIGTYKMITKNRNYRTKFCKQFLSNLIFNESKKLNTNNSEETEQIRVNYDEESIRLKNTQTYYIAEKDKLLKKTIDSVDDYYNNIMQICKFVEEDKVFLDSLTNLFERCLKRIEEKLNEDHKKDINCTIVFDESAYFVAEPRNIIQNFVEDIFIKNLEPFVMNFD